MTPSVRNVLIVAAAILVGLVIYWRFSPYEQCVRAETEQLYNMWYSSGDYPAEVRQQAKTRAKVNCAR